MQDVHLEIRVCRILYLNNCEYEHTQKSKPRSSTKIKIITEFHLGFCVFTYSVPISPHKNLMIFFSFSFPPPSLPLFFLFLLILTILQFCQIFEGEDYLGCEEWSLDATQMQLRVKLFSPKPYSKVLPPSWTSQCDGISPFLCIHTFMYTHIFMNGCEGKQTQYLLWLHKDGSYKDIL